MLGKVIQRVFGTKQDKDLKILRPIVEQINALEPTMQAMSDEELKAQTNKFRKKVEEGVTLDEILPEAFATVREASVRTLKMRHFDVQLMGGIVLHRGIIAEMKTGEGKTLTATLAMYLNGLSGLGCHLVTVNDYLAARDAEEMGVLYNWLDLSVGCILADMDDDVRKAAYKADITYGTNNEFAFDYLRDNMKFDLDDYVQRDHNFCIVDEVDSILIDEARTPLLISGPSEGDTGIYERINRIIPKLEKEKHFTVDEKSKSSVLTDDGVIKIQEELGIENLYELANIDFLHSVNQALKAHTLFVYDVDYVVKEGRVIIVDEFTGRLKDGSRWSDGLHQAVEAKEGVPIKSENQTLASITFQNYFRLYNRLSGMTGTADTEAEEFHKIYKLDVIVVPTNVPLIRDDQADVVYASKEAKYKAIGKMIIELHKKGQPILVGTISIDSSVTLSEYLTKEGIKHEVLNAKQHEREAHIIANAGQKNALTIATNMAGRGTDIKLTPETVAAGGLCIICTERHESRRIDNQLRGRSGRQGDPGLSKFFLSLEDDLMRIFGSDKIKGLMTKLGMNDEEPIEHNMITNAIAKAQKRVEGHNFEIRKHLLDFDNVMNEQRKVIYKLRREILGDDGNRLFLAEMIEDVAQYLEGQYRPTRNVPLNDWPWEEMKAGFQNVFKTEHEVNINDCIENHNSDVFTYFSATAKELLEKKFSQYDEEQVKVTIREILLSTFDSHWKDHLLGMDHLKEGIGLRSYGQKDPLVEYKREAFDVYENMKAQIKHSVVETIFEVRLYTQAEVEQIKANQKAELESRLASHRAAQAAAEKIQANVNIVQREESKVGRNDPCPCGSGKKYKRCHGA